MHLGDRPRRPMSQILSQRFAHFELKVHIDFKHNCHQIMLSVLCNWVDYKTRRDQNEGCCCSKRFYCSPITNSVQEVGRKVRKHTFATLARGNKSSSYRGVTRHRRSGRSVTPSNAHPSVWIAFLGDLQKIVKHWCMSPALFLCSLLETKTQFLSPRTIY